MDGSFVEGKRFRYSGSNIRPVVRRIDEKDDNENELSEEICYTTTVHGVGPCHGVNRGLMFVLPKDGCNYSSVLVISTSVDSIFHTNEKQIGFLVSRSCSFAKLIM